MTEKAEQYQAQLAVKENRVYVNGGTCPEPPGTNRNPPEPTRNLEKSANDKIKKKQITKNNTNQIKIMKMK